MAQLYEGKCYGRQSLLTVNDIDTTIDRIGDIRAEVIPRIFSCHKLRSSVDVLVFPIGTFKSIKDIIEQPLDGLRGPFIFSLIKVDIICRASKHAVNILLIWQYVHCRPPTYR